VALIGMKIKAPSSGCPTRAIELLIAEPRPEKRPEIELIRVLVSGATTHEIPRPKSSTYGRMSTKYGPGGTRVAG